MTVFENRIFLLAAFRHRWNHSILYCTVCSTCKLTIMRPRLKVPLCGYPSISPAIPLFSFTKQSFDSNGDGLVTKSELREALWSLGQHPCDEEIDNLFQVYDDRKVGALDSSDFRRLILEKLSYKVSNKMKIISYLNQQKEHRDA